MYTVFNTLLILEWLGAIIRYLQCANLIGLCLNLVLLVYSTVASGRSLSRSGPGEVVTEDELDQTSSISVSEATTLVNTCY